MKIIRAIIKKYKAMFDVGVNDSVHDTFRDELNYESGRISYVLIIALFAWLPYIFLDLQIHKFPTLAVCIRLGLTLSALVMIVLKLTRFSKLRSDVMLMIPMSYLYFATVIITVLSGEAFLLYIGGLIFVFMIPIFSPLPLSYKIIATICSFVTFIVSGKLCGINFSSFGIRYTMNDLIICFIMCILFSVSQNELRFSMWKQRQELKDMVAQNEKNLATIVNLAHKAEASDRAKSKFLATMSHEIRTPMNAIIGITQIQLQNGDLPDEYTTALEKIYSFGNNLLGIINDILDISKIEAGMLDLNPTEYDTLSLINDVVQLNIVRIGSKPIEFDLHVDESLPSKIYGDELRVKQILNNLLSNAIKYTKKGHIKLSVSHWRDDEDNITLRFAVEDTGQGIKQEDQEQLFSEYLRFNAYANRTTEGTGLGLSITKKLVEMMDGDIRVESEYGKGSVFTVTVRQKAVECGAIGEKIVKQLRNFSFSGKRRTMMQQIIREPMPYGSVLIVDDLEINLYVAEGLLSPYKLKVETATSGFAAIEIIGSGKTYDLIFMDHMMPNMDGIETMQRLREAGYTGAIVALTANAMVGNEEMLMQKGFDGFISKPIDARQMDTVLNRFIRDRHLEEAGKIRPEAIIQTDTAAADPKLSQIFRRDAEKAVATLRKTTADGDISLFTTTVHAMKSALANVGEHEASRLASALESAGLSGDSAYISANVDGFIETLQALADKLGIGESADLNGVGTVEDAKFLMEQLRLAKAACENYDDDAAYAALNRLKEMRWKPETAAALEQINDALFICSDFEGAAEQCEGLIAAHTV